MIKIALILTTFLFSGLCLAKSYRFNYYTLMKFAEKTSKIKGSYQEWQLQKQLSHWQRKWHFNPYLSTKVGYYPLERNKRLDSRRVSVSLSQDLPYGPSLSIKDDFGFGYIPDKESERDIKKERHVLSANLKVPLLKGVGDYTNRNYAKIDLLKMEKLKVSETISTNTMIYNVSSNFMNIELEQRKLQIKEKSYENMRKREKKINRLVKRGFKARTDQLWIQEQIIRTKISLQYQKNRLTQAKNRLKRSLYLLPTDKLDLNLSLKYLETRLHNNANISSFYKQNPTLMKERIETEIQNLYRKNAAHNLLPNLSVQGTYSNTYLPGEYEEPYHKEWSLQASFSMPLGFHVQKADYTESKLSYFVAVKDYHNTKNQQLIDFTNLKIDLEESRNVYQLLKQKVKIAKEKLDIMEKSYFDGRTSANDLFYAQINYEEVQADSYKQKINYLKSYLSLLKEMGTLQEVLDL